MAVRSLVDIYVVYRIIRLLVTKWEDQDAFKFGIIDDKGKVLRKASTLKDIDEKESYTLLHRFVFNLKRLLGLIPFGKTKLASYLTALTLLLKEDIADGHVGSLNEYAEEFDDFDIFIGEEVVNRGTYKLKVDILIGDGIEKKIAKKGDIVMAKSDTKPFEKILGDSTFRLLHLKTGEEMLVRLTDLEKVK